MLGIHYLKIEKQLHVSSPAQKNSLYYDRSKTPEALCMLITFLVKINAAKRSNTATSSANSLSYHARIMSATVQSTLT